jgi:hypothetical protein
MENLEQQTERSTEEITVIKDGSGTTKLGEFEKPAPLMDHVNSILSAEGPINMLYMMMNPASKCG